MPYYGHNQRFCTHCGSRMVPNPSRTYPQFVWLACPREFGLRGFLEFLLGHDHDVAIIGDQDPPPPAFDPYTGTPGGTQ